MISSPTPGDSAVRQHYQYDAWNRLVKVSADSGGSPGATIAEFTYDGRNYRVTKTAGSDVTEYYYNEQWQVLEERDGSGNIDRQYVWNPEYVDSLATTYTDNGTGYDQHFYLHDANYNITAVLDASGTVVERYAYTPYGEVTILNGESDSDGNQWIIDSNGSDIDNEHLYTGRRTDSETGLKLNRNRYYQADLGRWINRDPIGYAAGDMNVYAYVGGRVLGSLDPEGLRVRYVPGVGDFSIFGPNYGIRRRSDGTDGHAEIDIKWAARPGAIDPACPRCTRVGFVQIVRRRTDYSGIWSLHAEWHTNKDWHIDGGAGLAAHGNFYYPYSSAVKYRLPPTGPPTPGISMYDNPGAKRRFWKTELKLDVFEAETCVVCTQGPDAPTTRRSTGVGYDAIFLNRLTVYGCFSWGYRTTLSAGSWGGAAYRSPVLGPSQTFMNLMEANFSEVFYAF